MGRPSLEPDPSGRRRGVWSAAASVRRVAPEPPVDDVVLVADAREDGEAEGVVAGWDPRDTVDHLVS